MSLDEVLAARPLAFPITVPMCSPLTDGAAAVVVCRESVLKRYGVLHPVRVRACRVATGLERDLHDYETNLSRLCGLDAYEEAGMGPADIDVAEVHDATAFAEIQLSEMLGLFPVGDGGPAAERGDTRIGGSMPINPSGGLEAKGHPLAATGLGQIFELVDQLRGRCGPRQVEAARVGLAENGGGFHRGQEAVAVVTILEAV
ncbi:acetyl-CoA acetyltransferase [Thermocatellispora tengchongensis]|uniref:Acetyl-CoA acetyltransferase n=1 Tax=Thermocatellispora tengchongensis TaxID=1073253 RepID=A0A840PQF0_9ACTN|nr:thiolase family protein [Thermocatellispora tengchongensis]MBB5139307.1 acetyl-CoA acetyltransferase [Thermocatellispora tengchongensis]